MSSWNCEIGQENDQCEINTTKIENVCDFKGFILNGANFEQNNRFAYLIYIMLKLLYDLASFILTFYPL